MSEIQVKINDVVSRIFSNWTALRMAVEHGQGSHTEAVNFCEWVAKFLDMNDKQMHYSDVSTVLADYMDEIFNTVLEDDSENQVAQELVRFHLYMINNDLTKLETELEKLPNFVPWLSEQKNATKNKNNDSESNDDMDTSIDDSESENKSNTRQIMDVDEDGWSVVTRKR